MSNFDDDFSDLDEFESEFTPQPAIAPNLDALPNGSYEFEVLDAELTRAQNGDRICKLGLRLHTGAVVQHTYWLTRQIGINRLGYDLGVLGFNTEDRGDKSLGQAIADAVKRLPGVKFRGTKTSRKKDANTTYHDLNVSVRTGGTPMPSGAEAAF